MASQVDNDTTERVRSVAQQPLNRLWGKDTHSHWTVVEGHNVWQVQRVETGEKVIVKFNANVALARVLALSGKAPRLLEADNEANLCIMEDLGDDTLADILGNFGPDPRQADWWTWPAPSANCMGGVDRNYPCYRTIYTYLCHHCP